MLVTFDPHPTTVTGPSRDASPLATITRRARLAREHGADAVVVLPFDDVMASTAADRFAVDVLVRALSATDVVASSRAPHHIPRRFLQTASRGHRFALPT